MKNITKIMGNKLSTAVMIVLLSMSMTACTGNNDITQESSEENETIAAESVTTEEAVTVIEEASDTQTATIENVLAEQTVYPIEITDSYGDVVTLEYEPEKVVSVAPNLTELMYELDAADKLVGRSDYCDYPQEVLDVESVGSLYTPDIEKIISMEPDLVIVSTHFDEENAKKLEDLDIPVLALYEEHDVTGVYDMIDILGKAVNRNTEAAECISRMQDTIGEVRALVEEVETPSVYYVVGFGEYGDYTAGGDTFIGGLIELAGGYNIAKEVRGWNITLEEIIEADPSIIITSEYDRENFMSDERYADLTAVKEEKVYAIDTNMLDRQGYRNAEGIKVLAEIFHPEVFE